MKLIKIYDTGIRDHDYQKFLYEELVSLDLNKDSVLIVTDFDLNPKTTNDRSLISSDVAGKGNYTERLDYTVQVGRLKTDGDGSGGGVSNTKVIVENSDFEHIKALRFTGEDLSLIHI